jgi:type III pantothenate kinase
MKPNIVVDVGNSRIKWGRCFEDRVVEQISLPPYAPESWGHQIGQWDIKNPIHWALASVSPENEMWIFDWVKQRGDTVISIQDREKLPIDVQISEPNRVGFDRLLNAVAAKDRVARGTSIFIIDAGSAVTVDWVDQAGAFRGGAIFPGAQLMANALHDYTAALPILETWANQGFANPQLPGTSTIAAIEAGIFWAVAGGIKATVRQLSAKAEAFRKREIFLTGGEAWYLAPIMDAEVQLWPTMTLEGIRLAAEALP